MVASYTSTSVADMLAAFLFKSIEPITSRPSLAEILHVLKHLSRCSRAIKSRLGPLRYLFVLLDKINYRQYTAVPINISLLTPNTPTFTDGISLGEREIARF